MRIKNETGESLLEVIIAISVGILVVMALTIATIFSLRNAQGARNSAQATQLAQEGIERVRTGRDRNALINGLTPAATNCPVSGSSGAVNSWNGSSTGSSIWNCIISGSVFGGSGVDAYFRLSTDPLTPNDLTYINATPTFPTTAESIGIFKRAVILADTAGDYGLQKTITVVVQWSDFSGTHESRLSTILRKI